MFTYIYHHYKIHGRVLVSWNGHNPWHNFEGHFGIDNLLVRLDLLYFW